MNKLEQITSIIILSSIPHIINAQSSNYNSSSNNKTEGIIIARLDSRRNEEYNLVEIPVSTPKEMLNKESSSDNRHIKYINYFNNFKPSNYLIEDNNSMKIKPIIRREDMNLAIIENTIKKYLNSSIKKEKIESKYLKYADMTTSKCYYQFKKQKTLGADHEYKLNKNTGMCLEESFKIYDGKVNFDHVGMKLILHIGEYKKR